MNAVIEMIASNMAEMSKPLVSIKAVLEDGAALAGLGFTDEDQELVEVAHDEVCAMLADGREFL